MDKVLDIINQLVWIALGLSTLMAVVDWIGLMPKKIRDRLKLNRSDDTLDVLKQLGINIDLYKRKNSVIKFPKDYSKKSIEECVENEILKFKINKTIAVGRNRPIEAGYYIDLIGATCNQQVSKVFARYLSTYWSNIVSDTTKVKNPNFDFVVSPKGGSPILGYEFSNLINCPFVLHEDIPRFKNKLDDFQSSFNCYEIPDKDSIAIIVDDSTTGGTMVLETIEDLRKFGYRIEICLVVFEPKHKDARKKLLDKNVELISIIETHKKEV